jgi:activating signal cointegrator 1
VSKAPPPSYWRALTVRQPWAQAIALGAKRWETRKWETDYRGPLLIHAGIVYGPFELPRAIAKTDLARKLDGQAALPRQAIVAHARLVSVCEAPEAGADPLERALGDFSLGRYAWRLEDVRRIDPIPCRGYPGLWVPDSGLVEELRRRE